MGFGVGFFADFEFGFGFRDRFFRDHHFFRHHEINHVNIFHHWDGGARLTGRPGIGHIGGPRIGRSGIDAFAGRDGHVFRRDGGQWLQHNRAGGWEGVRGPTAEHEQSHQARQLGEQRLGTMNRGLGSGGTAGGGFHGGGSPHGGGGFGGGHGGGGHGR
jgi:hypothetical protein